jgi:PmbA protein
MTQTADAPNPALLQDIAESLVARALKAGADSAEATVSESRAFELAVRDGKLEDVERSESLDAGVRVFVGKQPAGVAFSDLSEDGARQAVERAVAMARHAPEDPYAGLAEADQLCREFPDIPLYDGTVWDTQALEDLAGEVEKAARDVPGVSMTDNAFASGGSGAAAHATSAGFAQSWRRSSFSLGTSVIAEKDGAMERDYAMSRARRPGDLRDVTEVGREAGERAARRVGPVKLDSGARPVVFDRRVASTFLGALAGAVSGPAVARGVSFLREKMGEKIFADGVNILDEPHRPWGLGSTPFDAEGLANKTWSVIEDGRLTGWFLNLAASRQLGLAPAGHGRRNLGGPPGAGPTNFYMQPGAQSRDALIGGIEDGLLVTEMFGPSLNSNTGDWSVGVSGYRIVKGAIDHPVSEITVAGNLIDIFGRLIPADDLRFDGATNAPSVLVDQLAVGGA